MSLPQLLNDWLSFKLC